MKHDALTIYWTSPVKLRHKFHHVRKLYGRSRYAFAVDYGEMPISTYNDETQRFETVDHHLRGLAYAARKRMKYRKNKKREAKSQAID